MIDAIVREIEMPMAYRGFVKIDPDGVCNIYINCDLSEAAKKIALRHEIQHVENGDFESTLPVELIEAANKADPDMSKVCWIGRGITRPINASVEQRIGKIMSIMADGGKIVEIK